MNPRSLLLLVSLGVLGACASSAPTPDAPAATSAPAPESSARAPAPADSTTTTPTAAPTVATAAPEKAAAARPPKSTYLVAGTSANDAAVADLRGALEKLGWKAQDNPETKVGNYEQLGVSAKKGTKIVTVTVSRWAKVATPITDATDEADFAPARLMERYKGTEHVKQIYDDAGQVLVSVLAVKGATDADAQKLLDTLVTKAK